eukprot:gb/GECH01014189.1/.p1 GENE.gb/GECH01014189.1/~~gb/GECH01014189.1/.p1  ORF type:complete len:449 (+),score=80.66 gb/GECH01014189.1/:1-1347(+)
MHEDQESMPCCDERSFYQCLDIENLSFLYDAQLRAKEMQPTPSMLRPVSSRSIVMSDNRRIAEHTPPSPNRRENISLMADKPLPVSDGIAYFEMTILSAEGLATIGVASDNYPSDKQPGWRFLSYGYHGDDGKKFDYKHRGRGSAYGPCFGTGDTVGCGIDFSDRSIFFVINGKTLPTAFHNADLHVSLFPIVGLDRAHVQLNFGQDPFSYKELPTRRSSSAAMAAMGVLREKTDPSSHQVNNLLLHDLVEEYLSRTGCVKTLSSLGSSPSDDTQIRRAVQDAVLSGNISQAEKQIQSRWPQMFSKQRSSECIGRRQEYEDAQVALSCQQFIELLRESEMVHAMEIGAQIQSMRDREGFEDPPCSDEVSIMAEETLGLVAYQNPEDSPVRHRWIPEHRERVAEIVDTALVLSSGKSPLSRLEYLLKQLSLTHEVSLFAPGAIESRFKI